MKFKELGSTGEKVSCIGMGTWKLEDNEEGIRAIKEGLKLGITLIDTAEMYGTEGIVSRAIKGEKDVFIATKVSPHHFRRDDLIRACDSSLRGLGVKAIDLYQLHWPNEQVPIEETMGAMEKLVKDGKIRHIGVCNFSAGELAAAREALKKEDIVSDQVEYSVFVKDPMQGVEPYCIREKMSVIAYSPFGRGMMFDAERREALEMLNVIGKRYGKTGAQVALNWLISKKAVIPIPKAGSPKHMAENVEAADFKLSDKDMEKIEKMGSSGVKPIASRMNRFTRKTTFLWSNLMQKRERLRVKHGI